MNAAKPERAAASSLAWNAWRVFRYFLAAPFGALGACLLYLWAQSFGGHGIDGLAPYLLGAATAALAVAGGIARARSTLWVALSLIGGGLLVAVLIMLIQGLSRAHW